MANDKEPNPYDRFAQVYDTWVDHYARELDPMRDFYVAELLSTRGPVAELGVGNGRILIAVARAGKTITGVDSSAEMIALCERNARQARVADRVELQQADFREFRMPLPASTIAIPYEAIGHLIELDEKRGCLENVFRQLRPGGRLILDQRVYDPELAASENGQDRLAFEYEDPATGRTVRFWLRSEHDIPRMSWTTRSWLEWTADDGSVSRQILGDLPCSNTDAPTMQALLEGAGFEIDDCLDDFAKGTPMDDTSEQQIWLAHRPDW